MIAFSLFEYKQTTDTDMYVPTLPLPPYACIQMVLKIVQDQETKCNIEISVDESIPIVADRSKYCGQFTQTLNRITRGFIGKQILGTMSTVQVVKNWNSHGAELGSSLCQLTAILSSLDYAREGDVIQVDFPVLIPQGNVLMGHKHGHHNVVYVEYMTTAIEPLLGTGGTQNYLAHGNFMKKNHGAKVSTIMG